MKKILEDGQRKVVIPKWVADTWEELKKRPKLILDTFKRCGFANDIHGRENHKVRLRHVYWYKVSPKSDKGKEYEPLTKEKILEGEEKIRHFRKLSRSEQKEIMDNKRKNYYEDSRKKKKMKI